MEQDQQTRWRPTRRQVLWTVGIVVALVVATIVLGYVREWEWAGLVKDQAYTKRTLWDWLKLLIIPAVLAGVGLWFNRQQRAQELQTADRRTQDEALQAYLDQMSDMLIPNKDQPSLSDEHPPDSLKTVARARTLTVLPRLAGDRKARVVQFLYKSGLITEDRVLVDLRVADLRWASLYGANLEGAYLRDAYLEGANLSRANLSRANLEGAYLRDAYLEGADLIGATLEGADLSGANLEGANLIGADLIRAYLIGADLTEANLLSGANLIGADLIGATLSRASLSGADLIGADLIGADLSGADLSGADLSRANLSGADLIGATLTVADLRGANLSGAKGWTEEQLAAAESLTGATMPDGQHYEEWLKSKGRGEDAENSGP